MLSWVFLVPLSYLFGTFPTAILVSRRKGKDPTREGSGNPGATNVTRTVGRRAGAVVLLGDAGKGAIATALGLAVGGRSMGLACGVAAVVGHIFPATRIGRGGKGVATALGVAVVAFPINALAATTVWLLVVITTRRVALGSIGLVTALPLVGAARGSPWWELAISGCVAVLVVARHRDNLERLYRGEERGVGPQTSRRL